MSLTFDSISSNLIGATDFGGQRDYTVDLTGNLETSESLSSVDVISSAPTVLIVSDVTVGTKTVSFHVKVAGGPITRTIEIDIPFIGAAGSSDTYRCSQPIVPKLRN